MLPCRAVLRMHPWELGPARVRSRLSPRDTLACSRSTASLGVASLLVPISASLKGGTTQLLGDENEPKQLILQALKGLWPPMYLPTFYPA